MTEPFPPPSPDELARAFIEQWQQQWSQMLGQMHGQSAPPDMTAYLAQMARMMPAFTPPPASTSFYHAPPPTASSPAAPTGATSLAAAFEPVMRQLDELARRLDGLTERVDALTEPRPRRSGAKAASAQPTAKPTRAAAQSKRARSG